MKKILFNFISIVGILSLVSAPSIQAQSATPIADGVDCSEEAREARQLFHSGNDVLFYDPCANSCTADSSTTIGSSGKDYKGGDVFNADQLHAIKTFQPLYEEAAKEAGMPWQMIAVIHVRETGLSKTNPSNGQGIYQDYAGFNGPYPPGPVDDAEFVRQTKWAAAFLKNKASQPDLVASKDEGQIKDAFFGYNGKAGVYYDQAERLGFSEGYEGSPYVMNIADDKRDPETNPSGWGQIKSDGGSIEFPANSDHGAFVMYTALAGSSSSAACPDEEAAGDFVYYAQLDTKWNEERLAGDGYIGADGCGPTSVAMIVATLADKSVTPVEMTRLGESSGAITCDGSGCGTNNSEPLVTAAASQYGLTYNRFDNYDFAGVIEWVKAGGLVMLAGSSNTPGDNTNSIVKAGPFSQGGHFVVVKGVTEDGQLIIANPYSTDTGGVFPSVGQVPTAPTPWPAEQTFTVEHMQSLEIRSSWGFKK